MNSQINLSSNNKKENKHHKVNKPKLVTGMGRVRVNEDNFPSLNKNKDVDLLNSNAINKGTHSIGSLFVEKKKEETISPNKFNDNQIRLDSNKTANKNDGNKLTLFFDNKMPPKKEVKKAVFSNKDKLLNKNRIDYDDEFPEL